jgi:hypothetical protein
MSLFRRFSQKGADLVNYTSIVPLSDEWKSLRSGICVSSSQAAAVFNGISTTTSHADFMRKIRGEEVDEPNEYTKNLMDAGRKMEPVLADEFEAKSECVLVVPNMFEEVGRVIERSTPDGIAMWSEDLWAVVEIKWRGNGGDGTWSDGVLGLGLTVFCQIQHQMHLTRIHRGFVYSGSPNGGRCCWAVRYNPEFRRMFLTHLYGCVFNESKLLSGPVAKAAIKTRMEESVEKLY